MKLPISTPRKGNRTSGCCYDLMRKRKGSVPGGASSSRQQNDVAIEIGGETCTSGPHNIAVGETEEEIHRNVDQERVEPEREEEICRNVDQERVQPEIEEEIHLNVDQERVQPETVEDINERAQWVTSIQAKINAYTRSQTAETETISIPRVPKGLRGFYRRVDKPYEPRVILIGPYHRENRHLKNMQNRKWQCLKDIRDNQNGGIWDLNEYYRKLKDQENRARSFYPESKQQLNRSDFLEMLLLDGCFIVDYLDRASSDESKTKIWSDHQIRNDLLLLENQLPFFVLECIYRLVKQTNDNNELIKTAVKFFHYISPKDPKTGVFEPEKRSFKHLLHLYHAFLFYDERNDWKQRGASQALAIPSAIFLDEAGVKFKKRKTIDKAMEVRFKDGVINITPLVVNTFTISQFLNLIEFERAHPDIEPRFTAFAQFMDYIINTSEDVALLRKKGILEHAFGSDEEVARIFNQLTGGTSHHLPWELKNVYEKAGRHCKAKRNRWRATFLRDYCSSPWAVMSITAGVLLVAFSFIQVFFTMYNRFRPVPPPSS